MRILFKSNFIFYSHAKIARKSLAFAAAVFTAVGVCLTEKPEAA